MSNITSVSQENIFTKIPKIEIPKIILTDESDNVLEINNEVIESNCIKNAKTLSVVSLNLLFQRKGEDPSSEKSWPKRLPAVVECIRELAPDILATQEGVPQQIQDLETNFPEYSRVGEGRDTKEKGKSEGESMAVFYRTDRFALGKHEDFWLSETPDK